MENYYYAQDGVNVAFSTFLNFPLIMFQSFNYRLPRGNFLGTARVSAQQANISQFRKLCNFTL